LAKFFAQDYKITIGTAIVSSSIAAVTLDISADEIEVTSFGDSFRKRIGGLKDASVSFDFHQDFGAGAVDALLFPLMGQLVDVKIAPTSGTVTATNPEYRFSALCTQYQPFAGSIGDLSTLSITWPVNGEVVRGTAPVA
jgi:hypothetical protein